MIYTIKNDLLSVSVSDEGAELQSIRGADGTEYLWQGDAAYWEDRSPTIFPYVGRMIEGSYYLDGVRHEMKIHGIAPYRTFSLVKKTEDTLIFEFSDDAEIYASYPRHFAFRVIYKIDQSSLSVTYETENQDDRTIYFGCGGHPGINVPLDNGLSFEDYRLRFDPPCTPERIGFTPTCFVNDVLTPYALTDGCAIPLRHDLFDDDAIVLSGASRRVILESERDSRSVTVDYPDFDFIGFWHAVKTDAPYVCIEPWTSLPSHDGGVNHLEQQPDLIRLEGGKTDRRTWTVTVK